MYVTMSHNCKNPYSYISVYIKTNFNFIQLTGKRYRFIVKIIRIVIIVFKVESDMRQNRFIHFLKSLIIGSLYILCPGGELRAKLYKMGSRIPFNMLPCKKSHFKWTSSIPVISIGLSLLYDPLIN